MTTRIKFLAAAVALASLHQGTTANAQEQATLEEVLVTARKRSENVMEIPVFVSVVDQSLIQAGNLQSINGLVNTTPGLKFNSAFGRQSDRPVVRGISAIQTANELAGFFIDGVYVTGSLQTFDLDSIARVEVIKGPQSATFGRRTFSGAINYVTLQPTDELSGNVKLEAGSNGHQVMSGSISDTLGNFGYRASLRDYKYDSDFKNTLAGGPDVGGEKSTSGNLALAYAFSESTSLSLNVNYVDSDDEPYPV